MSALTKDALYTKGSPGFLLDDEEAGQYVYDGLEDFAAEHGISDDSMFLAVRIIYAYIQCLGLKCSKRIRGNAL